MLYKFKSRVTGDLIMLEPNGRQVLEIMGKDPGASGIIGTQEVVRAAPDGTTLLVSVNTLVMNMALYPKQGFNPLTDLVPVSQTSWGSYCWWRRRGPKSNRSRT